MDMIKGSEKLLRDKGLIHVDSKVFYATDQPSSAGALFGIIGASIAMANAQKYIVAFENDRIKFFSIGKYGELKSENPNTIEHNMINFVKVGMGAAGLFIFSLKGGEVVKAVIYPSLGKEKRKENHKGIKEFYKTNFPKKK